MRIRLRTMIRGADITGNAGDEVEVSDAMASALVGVLVAETVDGSVPRVADPEIETATAEAPENAAVPRRRGSRRAEE